MEIKGVVYPIPKEIINSLFEQGKNIFVKFTTHEPSKKTIIKLKEGMKLYLYESHSDNCIIGEANISKVDYLSLDETLKTHKEKLMIPEQKLREYSRGREDKKLLILSLKDIRLYSTPKITKKRITMAGQYITSENKKGIFE